MADPGTWPRWPLLIVPAAVYGFDFLLWCKDKGEAFVRRVDEALADFGGDD